MYISSVSCISGICNKRKDGLRCYVENVVSCDWIAFTGYEVVVVRKLRNSVEFY